MLLALCVSEAEIIDFEDLRVLSVKRFDRQWVGRKLYRIPQEDLCQALGVGPDNKYESDGGPGIRAVLSLLNESDQRDEDRRIFMKTQIIFWLIAAIDGHAKNFSLFNRPGGFILTPLYDVMSADPHVNPQILPLEKIKLAMAIGDNRHYKVKEVRPRHWKQTAAKSKFSQIDEIIEEVRLQTDDAIDTVSSILPRDFPRRISEPIFKAMRKRAKILGH
ncbi:HipA domain-containing protein [Bdellovibrionota bacterium FG-2]